MAQVDRYKLILETQQAMSALNGLSVAVRGFIGALAVDQVLDFGKAIVDTTARYQNYENQLRLITSSQEELAQTMSMLTGLATENRAAFGDTVELYTKLRLATQAMGATNEDVTEVVAKFQQALAISGADANTAAGAIRQFGQAMASGTVRGDEFNSIVEALGPALAIMAQESGITVGKLREMSQNGELTAETFFRMVQSSNALTGAFNQMQPTIDQLETSLGNAFDRALVKIGELSGATNAYQESIRNLTRFLDLVAGTPTALVNLPDEELLKVQDAGAALDELNRRYKDLLSQIDNLAAAGQNYQNVFSNLFGKVDTADRVVELRNRLQELAEAQRQAAESAQAEIQRQRELSEARTQALAPFADSVRLAERYIASGYGGALQRNQQEIDKVRQAIEAMNSEAVRQYYSQDQVARMSEALRIQLQYLTEQQQKLNTELNNGRQTFEQFYEVLRERAIVATQEQQFLQRALVELKSELDSGAITADVYAKAVENINAALQKVQDNTKQITQSVSDYNERLRQTTEDAQINLDKLNMSRLDRELKDIEVRLTRDLATAIKSLNALRNEANTGQIDEQIRAITEATQTAINNQQRLATEAYAQQRSFEYGWKQAFESYRDDATNAAKAAERIFAKVTTGMEDLIVNFAKTGKFEFKSFAASVLEDLLRLQVRQTIANLFGSFGTGTTSLTNPFAGFFANGGTIPAGQFGVVGERGPEFVSGPATVIPNTGATGQVIYNISAVDAPSFQSLIARDPGFIHAVAQQGARKVPTRR